MPRRQETGGNGPRRAVVSLERRFPLGALGAGAAGYPEPLACRHLRLRPPLRRGSLHAQTSLQRARILQVREPTTTSGASD